MLKLILQGCAALAAAGIGSYLWLVRAPLEQLEEAGAQHARLQDEYVQRQKQRINLPLLQAQMRVLKDMDKTARMTLPDFDGLAAGPRDLEEAIRETAKEKQLTSRLEFGTTDWSSREFYYFRPFKVSVSGEFRKVVEFLQGVSTGSVQLRMVRIASLRPVAGRDEVALSLEGHAYRFRTDEQVAEERKANAQ